MLLHKRHSLALACLVTLSASAFAPSLAFADDAPQKPEAQAKESKPVERTYDPVAVEAAIKRTDKTEVKAIVDRAAGSEGTSLDVHDAAAGGLQETAGGLSRVHGSAERAAPVAGSARDVRLSAARAASVERPAASPRQLRRMNVARVVSALEPSLRACAESAPADKATGGTAVLVASVSPTGSVETTQVIRAEGASAEIVACAERHVRQAKFGAPGGAGVLVAIPVTFARSR